MVERRYGKRRELCLINSSCYRCWESVQYVCTTNLTSVLSFDKFVSWFTSHFTPKYFWSCVFFLQEEARWMHPPETGDAAPMFPGTGLWLHRKDLLSSLSFPESGWFCCRFFGFYGESKRSDHRVRASHQTAKTKQWFYDKYMLLFVIVINYVNFHCLFSFKSCVVFDFYKIYWRFKHFEHRVYWFICCLFLAVFEHKMHGAGSNFRSSCLFVF